MKLTTEYGELPIHEDMEITINEINPVFSTDGSASMPITIPATPAAMKALNYPARLGTKNRLRKVSATLSSGTYHKNGSIIIDSASEDGITGSFNLDTGSLYADQKDRKIRDILYQEFLISRQIPNIYSEYYNPHICTVLPVGVHSEKGTSFIINKPITDTSVAVKGVEIDGEVMPDNYGVSVFLYLYALLEKLFQKIGYTISYNAFKEIADLKRIVLLHPIADLFCSNSLFITYPEVIPDITFSELIDWLYQKFLAVVFIKDRNVEIRLLQDILSDDEYDMDLAKCLCGKATIGFTDPCRVVINVDTSLTEATKPAFGETKLCDFIWKYGGVKDLSTSEMSNLNQWYKYSIIREKSTGRCYQLTVTYYKPLNVYDGMEVRKTFVGSFYFNYDTGEDIVAKEFSPSDLLPPMTSINGFILPYLGECDNLYTSKESSAKSQFNKIIIAYDAGFQQGDSISYRMATTQKYNPSGDQWVQYSLNPEDIYQRFFSLYDKYIRAGSQEVSSEIQLPIKDLLRWDMTKYKYYQGQLLMCKELSYSLLNNKTNFNTCSFILQRSLDDSILPMVIETPQYYWVVNMDLILERYAELQEEYGNAIQYYIDDTVVKPSLPYPSSAGLSLVGRDVRVLFMNGSKTIETASIYLSWTSIRIT